MDTSLTPSEALSKSLAYLLNEAPKHIVSQLAHRYPEGELDTRTSLTILKLLLCIRDPHTPLPSETMGAINSVLLFERTRKLVTATSTLETTCIWNKVKVSVWRGDITTLSETTAIVNAANSQMLGCFQPPHKCIDNAIHAGAGPELRQECYEIMQAQGKEEETGKAKVTRGYCLPSEWVIHTVGPELRGGKKPSEKDIEGLKSCYRACLEACESLPALEDGRKVLAFSCISTGLFAFPQKQAAEIAVSTVRDWISKNPEATITDVIFNVFTPEDQEIYNSILSPFSAPNLPPPTQAIIPPNTSLHQAEHWLKSADRILISAGAGLSSSTGLDYTSRSLFSAYFPGFLQYGFRRLYDLFVPFDWPSEEVRWGYYFNHLLMIRQWPVSKVYGQLLALTKTFEEGRIHIRTSNADGFFLKNGFDASKISTPQGQYAYLQCSIPCRQEATFPSEPFLDAAIPFLDPETQVLRNKSKIPLCAYCGGDLVLCVRSGRQFIEKPFEGQERVWREFKKGMVGSGVRSHFHSHGESRNHSKNESVTGEKTVILELGVGMNTPSVLRWDNEKMVERGGGKVKLIRVGLAEAGSVEWGEEDMVAIVGDVGKVVEMLGGCREGRR